MRAITKKTVNQMLLEWFKDPCDYLAPSQQEAAPQKLTSVPAPNLCSDLVLALIEQQSGECQVPVKCIATLLLSYCASHESGGSLISLGHMLPAPRILQTTPHRTPLKDVSAGTVLRIRGIVPDKASRFHVNLLCSEQDEADAALHFNPRLDTSEVVFNSKETGRWGPEERGGSLPFRRGQPFEVLLIVTQEGFKTVIGDGPYHFFSHRIPLSRVQLVEVGGDVQLDSVTVF
ncbi:galectin-7 [Thomomys bottae]